LELPAGVTEANEPVDASALRELREEIGMQANAMRRIGEFFIAPGYTTEYLYIYLATDLTPAPLPGDEDEFIEVMPTPISETFAMVKNGQIRDAKTLAALLLATPYLENK
jgi:ADP-ribose pyrophosphatase